MKRLVLFDMDGTLADTLPLCVEAFGRATEQLTGRRPTETEITDTFGPDETGTMAVLTPGRKEEGVALYHAFCEQLHPVLCPAPFEGIREAIDALRRKHIRVALVTGKGRRAMEISLRALGLCGVFDRTEAGSPTGNDKPACIARTLDAFGIRADEAIYVGDTASDIRSAHAAGLPILSAAWAPGTDAEALKAAAPEYLCTTTAQFLDWIGALPDAAQPTA